MTVILVFLSGMADYRRELEKEGENRIHSEVEPLARTMYHLCESMHQASIVQRRHALTIMKQLMEKQGLPSLSSNRVPMKVTYPSGKTEEINLPRLLLGNKPLGLNVSPDAATPVVDEMMKLTGYHASIMLRINEKGDFVRIATSVVKKGKRQIGTVLPAVNPDGKPNPFSQAIIQGKTAIGRTYVDDYVFVSTALPLRDAENRIIGLYGPGIRQDLMENLRQAFMNTPVGKSGYFFIIGAKGRQKGRYILSRKGLRDRENLWDVKTEDGRFPAREVLALTIKQPAGKVVWYSYHWRNAIDEPPKKKYAALIYFKPWDWIIGASAYEEDFTDTAQRLGKRLENIIFQVLATGLFVLIVSAAACWILGKKISQPLDRAVDFADAISRGEFPSPLDIQSSDETGCLGQSLNTMSERLKSTLEERRQAEQDFRTLYEFSRDALLLIFNGKFIDCNKAAIDIFGAGSQDDIIGKEPHQLSPEHQPLGMLSKTREEELIEQTLVQGSSRFEWLHTRMDGELFFTEVQLSTMEVGGKPMILAAIRDITHRKKDEEQLLRLRSYLSNIIDSMPSVLIVVDRSWRITLWNSMAEKTTGIRQYKAAATPLFEVMPRLEAQQKKIQKAMDQGKIQKALKTLHKTENGLIYEDIIIYPLKTKEIDGAVIRMDDVTGHVKIEEMMIQSEKMMSVGGLAAGMAHEINNPLAGMIQGAQVVMNRLSGELPKNKALAEELGTSIDTIRGYAEQREILKHLSSIRSAGDRAARIVENMLSFSREKPLRELHDIRDLLDRTIELARNDYNLKKQYDFKEIEIIRNYQADLPKVWCEGNQIQQVFLNILKNGAQAMAENKHSGIVPCFTLDIMLEEDGMVSVSLANNGPGMDTETCKRVFEPFFTTKPVGVGTGLGLSVSFFIITRNHGGEIRAVPMADRGACFLVRLPVGKGGPDASNSSALV
ncbi:MAG: Cache 3/Cache 2 fusion domain-containing protein [Desulfobacter sp.]|nr:MAG: Cache 3/Cache 2 fusion domain-containing protein [Desulfobacter sp.]